MRAWSRLYRGNGVLTFNDIMVMVIVMTRFLEGEMKNIMRERKVKTLFPAQSHLLHILLFRFLKTKGLTWIHAKIE